MVMVLAVAMDRGSEIKLVFSLFVLPEVWVLVVAVCPLGKKLSVTELF